MYFIHRKNSNLLSTAVACHQKLVDAKYDAFFKAWEYDRDMVVTDHFGCKRHEINLADYED
tara:strand:- start:316 stop:498 length:183 start_codon:yes stop_codon:yes gene_type:complete